jgi:hypothetical protein
MRLGVMHLGVMRLRVMALERNRTSSCSFITFCEVRISKTIFSILNNQFL